LAIKEETEERLIRAFMELVVAHGYEGATTRAVAAAAGVNEVTLFRHFGDKETLARAAFTRFEPSAQLAAYDVQFDAASPALAEAGLRACLRTLHAMLAEFQVFLHPGLKEIWRQVGMQRSSSEVPRAVLAIVQRALDQAAPALRPEVDRDAAAFNLLGLVLLSVLWKRFEWAALYSWSPLDAASVDALFQRSLRPLIDWSDDLS
jgi:AcrR family transcriptional regulator